MFGRGYYLTDEIDLREFVLGIAGLGVMLSIGNEVWIAVDFVQHTVWACPGWGCVWNWVLFLGNIDQDYAYHVWDWPLIHVHSVWE